jgi:superfamily II DNA or RNA helicase
MTDVNMELEPYEWQKRLISVYRGKGVVKAFAGTGKTYATILLLKDKKYKDIIIGVPTRKLKYQWIEELYKFDVKNAVVETFHILSKDRSKGLKCDIFVVDECHRSTSPVFSKIYENINFDHVLGLSATPNKKSLEYCGNIIIDVPLKDAKISDFTVYFHAVDLDYDEQMKYDEFSDAIRRYVGRMRSSNESDAWQFREQLDSLIFKRRSLVYNAEERIPKAITLLKESEGSPTLVICKRIEQANRISKITGYPVYHSEKTDEKALNDFQYDRISTLISVGMLSEGYDKRNIKCLIIVSTAITEAYHIQSIGRAVRLPDDANIHIILARRTTDEKLLQFRHMYNHEIVGNFSPHALKPQNPWKDQYYLGDAYYIDLEGKIYQKTIDGKQFFKQNPISSTLQRFFNYRTGKFRITKDNLVIAKSGGKIRSLGILSEPLEKIKTSKVKPKKDYD